MAKEDYPVFTEKDFDDAVESLRRVNKPGFDWQSFENWLSYQSVEFREELEKHIREFYIQNYGKETNEKDR